jgi:hypothetical protein
MRGWNLQMMREEIQLMTPEPIRRMMQEIVRQTAPEQITRPTHVTK